MLMTPNITEIVNRRKQLGLSKRQLSLKSGLGSSSICRIENSNTKLVHILRAKAIAKVLKCRVEDIFNDID